MKKRIKITFSENTKSVLAETTIEYELENEETEKYINKDILQETKQLYDEAQAYAKIKTLSK